MSEDENEGGETEGGMQHKGRASALGNPAVPPRPGTKASIPQGLALTHTPTIAWARVRVSACYYHRREIAAFDIRTKRCDIYGQDKGEWVGGPAALTVVADKYSAFLCLNFLYSSIPSSYSSPRSPPGSFAFGFGLGRHLHPTLT